MPELLRPATSFTMDNAQDYCELVSHWDSFVQYADTNRALLLRKRKATQHSLGIMSPCGLHALAMAGK